MKRKTLILGILMVVSVLGIAMQIAPVQAQGVTLNVLVSDQQVPIIEQRVADFVAANDEVDDVNVVASASRADDQRGFIVTLMTQEDTEFDIVGMDVIWTAEFAANGWLVDLTEDYPQSELDNFLEAHVEAMMWDDKVYASPFFFDSGLLLYRQDILVRNGFAADASDFRTWTDFQDNLNAILDNETEAELNSNLEGYVAQSDAYEGGVVNLVEWMGGSGGTFLDEDGNPNFESARPALRWWKSIIAPRYTSALNNPDSDAVMERSELVGDEGSAVTKWLAGNAVFQRNWPFSYLLSLSDAFLNGSTASSDWPADTQRFGVTTLPYNATVCGDDNSEGCRTQALGGAVLGISAFSENVDAAKLLLTEIASEEAQLEMFTEVGNLPARKSVYTSGNIPNELSYAEDFYENVFDSVIPRPVHPDYAAMSSAIQPLFHDAIGGARDINEATELMNEEVNLILEESDRGGAEAPGFMALASIFFLGTLALVARYVRREKK